MNPPLPKTVKALPPGFFNPHPVEVAKALLGKVVLHYAKGLWLGGMVVEAEAYALTDKGSHASLGQTPSRAPLFQPPGTVYMYYARGGDSFNVSCGGPGDAVLVKAGVPWVLPEEGGQRALHQITQNHPLPGGRPRPPKRVLAGQVLFAKGLGLKVKDWSGVQLPHPHLWVVDVGYGPTKVLQTTRLGISADRDAHLPWRFIDGAHLASATQNPLTQKTHPVPWNWVDP